MRKIILFLSLFFLGASHGFAKVISEAIEYSENGQTLQGFFYRDDSIQGPLPGVLVFPEWRGLEEGYAKKRAEMLAELGYGAFAADMYGKGIIVKDHEEAGKLAGAYFKDRTRMRLRAMASYNALLKTRKVDSQRLAAIGYCFGGTTVLELARMGLIMKGVASFHGILATPMPAQKKHVQAKILVLNGAADKMTSMEDLQNFESEMKSAEVSFEIHQFKDAMHSFTVWDANMPEKGIQYNEQADKESWEILKNFLKEIFESKTKKSELKTIT